MALRNRIFDIAHQTIVLYTSERRDGEIKYALSTNSPRPTQQIRHYRRTLLTPLLSLKQDFNPIHRILHQPLLARNLNRRHSSACTTRTRGIKTERLAHGRLHRSIRPCLQRG